MKNECKKGEMFVAEQENAWNLFHRGIYAHAWKFMGCHREGDGLVFCAWAPHAQAVCLVGSFNGWREDELCFVRVTREGLWELHTGDYPVYSSYKFVITGADGQKRYKADPYAFHTETAPQNASKIYHTEGYDWGDMVWRERSANTDLSAAPVNVYQVHLASWQRNEDGTLLSYDLLADRLIPYVKKMGYTHVELLPITEYPYDDPRGYRVTGYFAPTSRHGDPHAFMRMVDRFHRAGVGVLLDLVPFGFAGEEYGLCAFDGAACYESGVQEERETVPFCYGREEVVNFLLSSALFWLEEYHVDGFFLGDVSSIFYPKKGEKEEWREDPEGVAFLQTLSQCIHTEHPHALLIARETTSRPMVTGVPRDGGLGFTHKWNVGWRNDVLSYVATDLRSRNEVYRKLTISAFYAFSENFILPISCDRVAEENRSLIEKMPGTYEEKFAGLRALMGYMMAYPGKKLLFMGEEFAQFAPWKEKESLEWFMLDYPAHKAHQEYVARLNEFYLAHSELWEQDTCRDGFEWLVNDDVKRDTVVFRRMDKSGNSLICVCCFSGSGEETYRFGVPEEGRYTCLFSSEEGEGEAYSTEKIPSHNKGVSLCIPVRPLSVSFWQRDRSNLEPTDKTKKIRKNTSIRSPSRKDGHKNVC